MIHHTAPLSTFVHVPLHQDGASSRALDGEQHIRNFDNARVADITNPVRGIG